jgi:hypothetical protein
MQTKISRKKLIKKFRALGYSGPLKEILRQAGIGSDEWNKI